jgi:hypothetical protein
VEAGLDSLLRENHVAPGMEPGSVGL